MVITELGKFAGTETAYVERIHEERSEGRTWGVLTALERGDEGTAPSHGDVPESPSVSSTELGDSSKSDTRHDNASLPFQRTQFDPNPSRAYLQLRQHQCVDSLLKSCRAVQREKDVATRRGLVDVFLGLANRQLDKLESFDELREVVDSVDLIASAVA